MALMVTTSSSALNAGTLPEAGSTLTNARPGVATACFVVLTGLGVTAFCFHALRVRAALRWRRESVTSADLRSHLALSSDSA